MSSHTPRTFNHELMPLPPPGLLPFVPPMSASPIQADVPLLDKSSRVDVQGVSTAFAGPSCGLSHVVQPESKLQTLCSLEFDNLSPAGLEENIGKVVCPPEVEESGVSIGYALHGTGCCRPCAWFWKPQGCSNGRDCRHCHACPEGETKLRKKAKVVELRQSQTDAAGVDAVDASVAAVSSVSASCQMGSLGGGKLRLPAEVVVTSPPGLSAAVSRWGGIPCHSGVVVDACTEGKQIVFSRFGINDMSLGDGDVRSKSIVQCPEAEQLVFSVGSALHGSGCCSPCAWFWKPQGCGNGVECRRCHLCPPEEIKMRKKEKKQIKKHEHTR